MVVGWRRARQRTDQLTCFAHNFTNEGGAFGTIRFLKNVMGLWILESCRSEWREREVDADYDKLLARLSEIDGYPR